MERLEEPTTAPLVSIIIPAYNHAAYVAETIDSVLRQTYAHWELIIIDDGSTDETPAIIPQYADPRLRAFRQENHGLSATLNRGISLARGKYFAFLPSDDAYEPEKLAVQVAVMEAEPAVGVVFSRQTVIDAQGQPTAERQVQEWFEVPFQTKEEIFPALFERDFLSTPTHLVRMECFARVGVFDESLVTAQDYDLWLRILKHYDIRLLPQPLVRMRWHGQNQTREATPQTQQERAAALLRAFRSLSIVEIFPSLKDIASEVYPELFAHAYLTLARYVMRSGLAEMVPVARLYLTRALEFKAYLHIPEELSPLLTASPGLRHVQESTERELRQYESEMPSPVDATSEVIAPVIHRPSEKLNVVIEVPTLDTGGVEEVVFSMVTGLPREQFRFLIVCIERGGFTAERCRRQGVPVEVLSGDKTTAYREILQRYRAHLVVSHYSHFGLPITGHQGIPVISFVHGLYAWFQAGLLGEMGAWDQYVSRYVAVSHDIADYLIRHFHFAAEKVSVIPNGIELVEHSKEKGEAAERSQWGLRPEDYVFLIVAAISPTKGHFALLEALHALVDDCPEVKVLCVGATLDEKYHQRLLEKRQEYQLEDRFIFAGFHADVAPFYRMADAFVLPSVLEGFGLVKLEAMAHGLPLILTQVGDSARLIESSDIGLLVPNDYADLSTVGPDNIRELLECETPSNVEALRAAMKVFLQRREQWREAGRLGREKVLRKFTREQTLKSYAALLTHEAWVEANRRDTDKVLLENRRLRTQVTLLEQIVLEKTQAVQERDGLLREKTVALQEQDLALRTQEQRFSELLLTAGQQQAQLSALEHTTAKHLSTLHRLSIGIFDRLDVTKRIRSTGSRFFWGVRRCLPQPVKRVGRGLHTRLQAWWLKRGKLSFAPSFSHNSFTTDGRGNPYQKFRAEFRQRLVHPVPASVIQQAEELLSQTPCRGVVLYPSISKWTEVLSQRPPQLLHALAAQGYLCIWGAPDLEADSGQGLREIEERLFLCSDVGAFHVFAGLELILWLPRADLNAMCDFFQHALVVYDIADALENFPLYCETFLQDHDALLRRADLVTVAAEELLREIRKIRGDALWVPNRVQTGGAAVDRWEQQTNVCVERLQSLQKRPGTPLEL